MRKRTLLIGGYVLMERLYKLEPGVVFTIDAKMWDKQYEKLDFPIDYVEINDGKIVLKLETVEKNQNQASLVAVLEIEKEML